MDSGTKARRETLASGFLLLGSEGRAGGVDALADTSPALPCPESDNSNRAVLDCLSTAADKRRWSVVENVRALVEASGLERCGFLTLTFKGGCPDIREAQRRFNNFATGVLRDMFGAWVCVVERHLKGGVHFHLVADVKGDIRTSADGKGVLDFDALKRRDYRTANHYLRGLWGTLRRAALRYGFGERSIELLPIRVSAKAVGRYVGSYLGKHLQYRRSADRRKKLVRYSKGANRFRQQVSWASPGGSVWRAKLGAVSRLCGGTPDDWALARRMGPRWAFRLLPVLRSMRYYDEPGRAPEFEDCELAAVLDVIETARNQLQQRKCNAERAAPMHGRKRVDASTFRNLETFNRAFLHSYSERPVGQVVDLTCLEIPDELWEARVESCHESLSGDGWTIKVRAITRTVAPGIDFAS